MRSVSRDQLDDDLKWHSDTVSKGVRTTAFATIAGIWAVMTAERLGVGPTGAFGISSALLVTWTFVLASATLLADIVQYVAAYLMTNRGIDLWEEREADGEEIEFAYDKEHLGKWGMFLYWINYGAFRVKLAAAILAGLAFVLFAFSIKFA